MKYRIDKENQVQTNANANENEPNVPPPLLAEIFKALRPHPEACAAVECLLAQQQGQTRLHLWFKKNFSRQRIRRENRKTQISQIA